MTERILGPSGSRSRRTRTPLLLMALVGLVLGVMIGGGGSATAAKGPSVAEYSQCANFDSGTACDAWINGILNPNNSKYREDQVTAQRLFVDFPTGGVHSFDLTYLVKKAEGHAYDSLATWNHTQTTADPCQGFNGPALTNCQNATVPALADTLPIDDDPLEIDSACTTESVVTSDHQLDGQVFTMFGGDLTNMDYAANVTTDSEGVYEGIHLEFTVPQGGGRVYLLFGGHLAASLTPATGSPRGWGDDCGASSISGGPYHIKLINIDGESAGNRDNQIMSNAVLPLITPTLVTTPSASATTSASIGDSLNVGNANAGGTATFILYPSAADCAAGTNAVSTQTGVSVSGGLASATNVAVSPTVNTTYYWLVSYSGDEANNLGPATTACGDETATVNVATTSTVP
jgi:hypothetical protein